MNTKIWIPFGYCLMLLVAGCGKGGPSDAASTQTAAKLDACQLLTAQEIEAVQGSPVKDTKSSEQSNGRIRTSQCYFSAEESSRSVSLTVTQTDPADADKHSAKTVWEETFGRYENEEKEKESAADKEKKESLREQKGEKEEETTPPKKITDVGEEAFWSGTRVGGALYALKKDVYIRISLGGADKEDARIDKSKILAQKALDRL